MARIEADGQDVSDLLIQKGLAVSYAVSYDGGKKGKAWCGEHGISEATMENMH